LRLRACIFFLFFLKNFIFAAAILNLCCYIFQYVFQCPCFSAIQRDAYCWRVLYS
jgi:hypothetical protein